MGVSGGAYFRSGPASLHQLDRQHHYEEICSDPAAGLCVLGRLVETG